MLQVRSDYLRIKNGVKKKRAKSSASSSCTVETQLGDEGCVFREDAQTAGGKKT